jgi:hypothetical protein
MALSRSTFPPHELTDDERAATVGRYDPDTTAVPDPTGPGGRQRRNPPPPGGSHYVRDEARDRAESIRTAVAQYEAVGAEVPDHLASLAAELPEPEPEPEEEPEGAEAGAEEAETETETEPNGDEEDSWEDLTVAELRTELDSMGIEVPPHAKKADLIELIVNAAE